MSARITGVKRCAGCGVTTTGEAGCWGYNHYGALGDGRTTDHLLPASVATTERFTILTLGNWHGCDLNTAGEAYCRGVNALGYGTGWTELQPAKVVGGHMFTTLTSGVAHTCGRTSSGTLDCWGDNDTGQLGDGPTTTRWAATGAIGELQLLTGGP